MRVALLKLCQRSMDATAEGLKERIRLLEHRIDEAPVYVASEAESGGGMQETENGEKKPSRPAAKKKKVEVNIDAIPEDIQKVIKEWDGVVEGMETINKAFLKKSVPINMGDSILYVVCDNELAKKHLAQEANLEKLLAILEKTQGKAFNVKIIDQSEYKRLSGDSSIGSEGIDDARQLFEHIQSKINFDIELR